MLGYWPYATHKKHFLYFFCQKTQASLFSKFARKGTVQKKKSRMAFRTQPDYWPKPVTGSATVACICMLPWQGN